MSEPDRLVIESLHTEEFMIPARDAGISLYLRNKRPADLGRFSAQRTLLFVHGATYPAETAFDLRLDGLSWMDYIAAHGYDVYLVDVRGYGRSSRPPQMDEAADANAAIVRAPTAITDVGCAVDFILQRRGIARLNLLGWSWGTTLMGWYTAQHNDKVEKLVLYAPQWIGDNRLMIDPGNPEKPLGAWRSVTREQMHARWVAGVPADKLDALIPPGWFDAWADATMATDTRGAAMHPPQLRAPNGVVQDRRETWARGVPQYDPANIRVPTLLVHAEWDVDLPFAMTHGYFKRLVNAPVRRMIEIGEGTHTVIMERNRMQLFRVVQQFLDEPPA
jgi:pimeloyl-ACP methyl ester carboxylesterase